MKASGKWTTSMAGEKFLMIKLANSRANITMTIASILIAIGLSTMAICFKTGNREGVFSD